MWWTIAYVVGAIVVIGLCVAGYLFYRGYQRLKGTKGFDGIPSPPMDNHMGHLSRMLSIMKHEGRLQITDAARSSIHQLVVMKTSSIFVNDAEEAGRIVTEVKQKGAAYAGYRLNDKLPDLFTANYEDWKERSEAFGQSMSQLLHKDEDKMTLDILAYFKKYSEEDKEFDLVKLFSLYALDIVCCVCFNYDLQAVKEYTNDEMGNAPVELKLPKNSWGETLHQIICLWDEKRSSSGIYADPNARPISAEELKANNERWKKFLLKMYHQMKTAVDTNSKDTTPFTKGLFGYAQGLVDKFTETAQADKDAAMQTIVLGELHQILRHGEESLGGALVWLFVCLHKNPRARMELEKELAGPAGEGSYVESVMKESMRRYPIMGNMTVRSVEEDDFEFKGGFQVPKGTPIFLHMFSLHNTSRTWVKPREFNPERWNEKKAITESKGGDEEEKALYPKCPFGFFSSNDKQDSRDKAYGGSGFVEGGLSFYPFGAGERVCPGRHFSLQAIRAVIVNVCSKYRVLTAKKPTGQEEEEVGKSPSYTIVPLYKQNTIVKAVSIKSSDLGIDYKVLVKADKGDGWADDSDDEDLGVLSNSVGQETSTGDTFTMPTTTTTNTTNAAPVAGKVDDNVDADADTDEDEVPDLCD